MMTSNFDRQELLGILNSLSDDRLVQALGSAGISIEGGGSIASDMALPNPVDELVPWNMSSVKVPLTTRPPIVNRSKITEMPQQPAQAGGYMGNPGLDNMAPFAATAMG